MEETLKLLVVNFPNFAGLVILAWVLWTSFNRVYQSLEARIAYLEKELSDCLDREL